MPETPPHLHEPVQRSQCRQDTDRGESEREDEQDTDDVLGAVDGGDKPGHEGRHLGCGRSMGGLNERHVPRRPLKPVHESWCLLLQVARLAVQPTVPGVVWKAWVHDGG